MQKTLECGFYINYQVFEKSQQHFKTVISISPFQANAAAFNFKGAFQSTNGALRY